MNQSLYTSAKDRLNRIRVQECKRKNKKNPTVTKNICHRAKNHIPIVFVNEKSAKTET